MSNTVKLHDKEFEVFIGEDELKNINKDLGDLINKDYEGKMPIILSILNGSFIFAADLVRTFSFPLTIEFVRYSSYEGTESTGKITKILGLKTDIKGKDILIIEDIIDTGATLHQALKDLWSQEPRSIKVVSLLLKPDSLQHVVPVDYIGKSIPNDFVVGYGLDYDELGRDLPSIYKLKSE